jgi:hypothetical protein
VIAWGKNFQRKDSQSRLVRKAKQRIPFELLVMRQAEGVEVLFAVHPALFAVDTYL